MMSRLEELTEDFGVTLKHMAEQSYKPLSNGDRIRAMSDEELAIFLECFSSCAVCREAERLDDNPLLRNERCDEDCETHIREWLKQPIGERT
jgi:hypothetical protein